MKHYKIGSCLKKQQTHLGNYTFALFPPFIAFIHGANVIAVWFVGIRNDSINDCGVSDYLCKYGYGIPNLSEETVES
jgi:hypothetical protein